MRRIMTRAQAIKYAVYAILLILILCIFPVRVFHETISSTGNEHAAGAVEVGGDRVVLQHFVPEYDHISSIGVYIKGDHFGEDTLTLRVFKESNAALLREVTVSADEFDAVDSKTYDPDAGEGYTDIYINLDVTVGDGYFYTMEGVSADYEMLYEMSGNSGVTNNGRLEYGSEPKEAYNLITRYVYEQPLRKTMSLILIAGLILLGILLTFLLDRAPAVIPALGELCTIRWIIRIVGNPVVAAATLVALFFIGPRHMFSIYISDIVVMILGVLILAGILLYFINRPYEDETTDPIDYIKENWRHIAQSVCIALALWACVEYMNGLYEIFHDIAWRKMAFFLGLGIIITFSTAELVNLINLALLIAGCTAARIYYVKNLADMVDEYHVEAMLWTCRLMPVILILAAYIIRCVITGIRQKGRFARMISWPYTIASVAMAWAMIARRHHAYWPILMTVIAAVFAVRYLFWEERQRFTGNISTGVLMHFAACVVFCVLHRPHDFSIYVRFPFVFHTVTITGEYLSLVMAASLTLLFSKYNRARNVRRCIPEIIITGVVAVYLLFTMSRTAMIAVVGMGVVMWIAYSFRDKAAHMPRIRSLLIMAAMVAAGTVICIPPVFTCQRALPALVGEPRLMEIETYPQALLISRDYDSEDYVTFSRLAKAFCHKMLGIDEDRIRLDLYTINGRRDDIYVKPSDLAAQDSACADEVTDDMFAGGVMLSRDALYSYDSSGSFVPPFDYPSEGEPPAQWWDEDYWIYDTETHEWEFEDWKIAEEEDSDVSNGRMDIYEAYLFQLNLDGHEDMGAWLKDGSVAAHAHNIYLQVAYDHGIIVGIMFFFWVCMTCVQALIVFLRLRKSDKAAGTVLAVSVMYAVCGLTEWVSHPCNPVGLIMLLTVVPLALYRYKRIDETV